MELEETSKALKPSKETTDVENPKDVTDIPPKDCAISTWDIIFLFLSIVTHCTDIGIDVNLVVQYYLNNKITMFIWTITLILVPSFINTIVSLQMYEQDEQKKLQHGQQTKSTPFYKKIGKFFTVMFIIIFQFTMAQRSYYSLKWALKSNYYGRKKNRLEQKKYFIKMLKAEQDVALLRVLECFIESAPQQILQLSIFVQDYEGEFSLMTLHQIISIISSFISLAWAMVSYHRSIRMAQVDKRNINFAGSVIQFLWHLLITTSRIACVSAVAVYSSMAVILACFFHWLGMTMWVVTESRGLITFCQKSNRVPHLPLTYMERIKSTLFSCVFGFVYIFIYLNPDDNGTYWRHIFYYAICFCENIAASILVIMSIPANYEIIWYHHLLAATCVVPFVTGIIIMIFYYTKFHPSMKHHTISFSKLLRVK
ncbi:hypothetical protein TKK_0017061 [Trichogramma kaykai]|uniref:XK-related protein n=1 Tax=Trichogramma kaykai TaxID=54128 RepID=A0ABD2W5D5_9HYME